MDRLPDIQTVEEARRKLTTLGSAMLVFWQLASCMREPRSQVPPAEILANYLSGLCNRRGEQTLRTALAMVQVSRLGFHPEPVCGSHVECFVFVVFPHNNSRQIVNLFTQHRHGDV